MLTSRPISRNNDLIGHRQMLSKTPGRVMHQNENANRGPATVHGKGKNTLLQTPFNGGKFNKEGTQGKQAPSRPLVDKTPFPNRTDVQFQTPYTFSFDKLSSPDSILRPSSLRRHVRVPRSATKSFETPINTGNPWQCDVSIGSPELVVQQLVLEDDLDEVEYMAPNTLDMPYVPPFGFDFPDYKSVGKTLLEIARGPPYENEPPPLPEVKDDELGMSAWDRLLPLPDLEDDGPKRVIRKDIHPKPNSTSARTTPTRTVGKTVSATKSTPNPSSRTGTAVSTKLKPITFANKATSRPATATSLRQPVVPMKSSRPATSQSVTTASMRSRVVPMRPTSGTQSRVVQKPAALLKHASSATNTKRTVKKPAEDPLVVKLEQDLEDFMFAV
ncbi:uncharacterized protein BT62DRAFT_923814 [Guyanagaster necrorhizus]|uniref:Uncharacterized protein n=1 Tax=Guyanagaster necrorhizus TaxID=856835 RepID=A0A9P8AMI5_9AGAR|nr:uncharacterized protein BT62DRAFT_923814 [Guyanagaster necrorhizus MCA 3950]KAG7440779.1 hypothetical protein BT62DRAFT_923814 [Guyanagaster necrorhizus MCA 3950]